MKRIVYLLTLVLALCVVAGCEKDKRPNVATLQINDDEVGERDSTVYGKCCDATMHTLSVVDNQGDTISYIIEEEDAVQGGLLLNDNMAVIEQTVDGEKYAQKVINITSLMGRWVSLDKNFEIKDGGVVDSHTAAESKAYTSWKIFNGKLVLAPDTFDIMTLGPDSLYLENSKGIFVFKRQIDKVK